jgi:hypothetical protein
VRTHSRRPLLSAATLPLSPSMPAGASKASDEATVPDCGGDAALPLPRAQFHAAVTEAFDGLAAATQPGQPDPLSDQLAAAALKLLKLKRGERVVDVACGKSRRMLTALLSALLQSLSSAAPSCMQRRGSGVQVSDSCPRRLVRPWGRLAAWWPSTCQQGASNGCVSGSKPKSTAAQARIKQSRAVD